MSGFNHFGKRLTTLWGGASAAPLPSALERPVVTRGQHVIAGTAQIESFLTRLLACRSELSSLMISSPGDELTMAFYRRGGHRWQALVLIASDAALERAVRDYFNRRHLEPSRAYPIPKGEGRGLSWGLVYPLPGLLQEVAQLTGELFRATLGQEPDLHFRFYEVAPPSRGAVKLER
jgi:hypothetical protein